MDLIPALDALAQRTQQAGTPGVDGDLRTAGFAGTVLVTRGNDVLLQTCAGPAERMSATPVHAGSRFGLASLSKMFTAATLLRLLTRAGRDPSLPVVGMLPSGRRPATLSAEVQIHHLLSHTSGIADYAEEDEQLPGYLEDYAALWHAWPSYRMICPDDFLPLYGDLPPIGPPGKQFRYSNAGYVLLAALVEELAGAPFPDVVRREVFEPLGMNDSGYFRLDEPRPDLATGYLRDESGWRSNVFSIPVIGGGDGGAWAPARDVDAFLRGLAGGQLLGPRGTELALTRHVPVGGSTSMGYGPYLGARGLGHDGGDPGVETFAQHFPATDSSLVVLTSSQGGLDELEDELDDVLEVLAGT